MGILSRILNRAPAAPAVQTRRFDGATGGRRGFGMGTFGRINPEIAAAGPQLRSRAAYLAQNNPWVAHAVANWTGALVGSGIMPVSRHPDAATRAALNAYFRDWTDSADAEGRTDFEGLQTSIAQSLVVTGEGLALIVDSDEGPKLRVLPVELLDESKTADLSSDRFIFSGVEMDGNGRRLAYHILPERPASVFVTYAPAQRIDAASVLHVVKPSAPGQIRGASWLAPIILSASDFDQYADALLMSAKVAAMHSGFIVNMNGAGTDPYDGADTPSMEPGTLVRLGMGDDVKFNSPAQLQQADAFLKHNLRQLAAGLGLPDHLVSGDLSGANYSSLRAGLLPFRQRVEQIQYGVLVPQFLGPIWRAVIEDGVLSGRIDAPDFEQNPRAYLSADWLPPKPLQVDPAKDVEATRAELELGLTSRRKAVAERGWALEDLDAEIAAERPLEQKDSKE
ncbi:phage portal protein [Paracoccus yeei]|uniref:phage portal protein n=1 Tax=Paracoccus yeei TaxID=147645 RepID=UPI0009DF0D8E|nr:phage portal protein [Paracoccus yeei]OWJ97144.1 phage portal protein [Paracoccus yeei]